MTGPDHVYGLISKYFASSGSELWLGGCPVEDIAARFGTPLYIYDGHVLDRKWDLLRSTLPAEFSICYSVKDGRIRIGLRHFLAKGAGLEVASAGELLRALPAGCAPEDILFPGPGKTEAELELALRRGIGEIHVESPLEARRIGAIATRLDVRARAAARVNPAAEVQGGGRDSAACGGQIPQTNGNRATFENTSPGRHTVPAPAVTPAQ